MKPIKVLHVISVTKLNPYLNNLCDFTDGKAVEYVFATFAPRTEFTDALEQRGKKVYCLGEINKRKYVAAARRLNEIFKTENPDIIHTHLFEPSLIGLSVAKWQKRHTVFTRHHSDAHHLLESRLKRRIYVALDKYINRRSDHIIAPSMMVRECLVDWEKTPPEKVSVIPYGQTTARFDAVTPEIIRAKREELRMNEQLSLVCVSRLFNRKGHIYLFEAIAPLIKKGLKMKLYLVGTGDYQDHLVKVARKRGILENIVFLGWRDDSLPIIGAADIIVHPSLEDALSQSLIESLMMERPIVATDISGVRDTLNNGRFGKIVPPADSESFASALEETVQNLEEAGERAKEGRKYLIDYMSAERTAADYVKIYQKVSSSK